MYVPCFVFLYLLAIIVFGAYPEPVAWLIALYVTFRLWKAF